MNDSLSLREAQAISLSVAVNMPPEPRPAIPRRTAPDVAHEHRDFLAFLEILRRQLQNSVETGEQAVLALTGDLLEIDRELSSLEREAPELLAPARARIDQRLADALARIQFQDTVKQQTGIIIEALHRLDAYAERIGPAAPAPELLQGLYASYISEQQRSIHEASLKRANTSSSADSQTELP